jgi:hypothetical protein
MKGNPQPHVSVLNLSLAGVILQDQFQRSDDLEKNPKPARGKEDSSVVSASDFIEVLVSRFDVDPRFFATHIWPVDWYSRRSSPATVPSSYTSTQEQPFLQFQYPEARQVMGVWGNHRPNHKRIMLGCQY